MHTIPLILPAIVWFAVLLWLSTRTVIDGAVITVIKRGRRTAVVKYRYQRRIMRFAAEVGPAPPSQRAFLRIAIPKQLCTTDGETIPEAEAVVIVSRLLRGLSNLDMSCEFYSPEVQNAGSAL